MEGAKHTKANWSRKCILCDVNFCAKDAYALHLLGKRHQKNIKKRPKSQLDTVRIRTVCLAGKLSLQDKHIVCKY